MTGRFLPRAAAAVLAAALGAVWLSGCGGDDSTPASTQLPDSVRNQLTSVAGIGQGVSTIVTAKGASVDVYTSPTDTQPSTTLSNPNENGAPRVFLVEAKMPDWWQVLLPIEPNGSTGWVRADQVTATQTSFRIVISRSEHKLRLYNNGEVVAEEPVGIGTADTPTPGGRFYLMELLKAPNPNGPYGPYAFGLNGFSTTLESFAGREPVIGLHGTNDPSSLGRDVSNGCIRLSNDAITRLAQTVPLGTPVEIVA